MELEVKKLLEKLDESIFEAIKTGNESSLVSLFEGTYGILDKYGKVLEAMQKGSGNMAFIARRSS